jgi:glycosyltransferase involved in cell wall biosynthesis
MTILILTHSYPDQMNRYRGNFVREQALTLGKVHEVIVVYFRVDYSGFAPISKYSSEKKTDGGITVYDVVTGRSFPVINQLKYFKDTYRFIKKEILANHHIDLIHCHLSYPAGFLGTWISERENIPAVLTEHTSIKKYYRSIVHRLCVGYALRRLKMVISVSNALRKEILEVRKGEVVVIPNVVDTKSFMTGNSPGNNMINIGFLGNMNSNNKGLDLLLGAVAAIDHSDIRLHVGGTGILMQQFKSMADSLGLAGITEFYGEIEAKNKTEFYSKLDFFVLPSRYETFGIVLVEAMASGLPVIASKCGGPEDIVTPETGLLIEKDDAVALSEALQKMKATYKDYDREMLKRFAEQNFGQEAFLERINRVYNKLIKE